MQGRAGSTLRQSIVALSGAVAVGVILDNLVKAMARSWLVPHEPFAILPGFNLTLGYNAGIAFGLFPASSASAFNGMIALQLALVAGLIVLLVRAADSNARFCLAAIIAGAMGNLMDRLANGAVTDYLDLYAGSWHWPAFNLADIFITLGVTGLVGQEFITQKTPVPES